MKFRLLATGVLGCCLLMFASVTSGEPAKTTERDVNRGEYSWRGGTAGVFAQARPPLAWGDQAHCRIVWKAKIGEGYSSPIIVGDRCFAMSDPDRLVCVDRKTGDVLWERTVSLAELPNGAELAAREPPPTACGFTTPTPASDGEHVYVVLGWGTVACFDLEGNRRWLRFFDGGRPLPYGRSASPLLAEGKLIVQVFHMRALSPATGETLWEAPTATESYATPAIGKAGDAPVVITSSGDVVRLADGKVLAARIGQTEYTTPLFEEGVVYFIDMLSAAYKISPADGDKIKAKELWIAEPNGGEFFASPVLADRRIYAASGSGVLSVLDAASGELLSELKLQPTEKRQVRLPGAGPNDAPQPASVYPSVSLAGGTLFVGNDAGDWWMLRPGDQCQELARHALAAGAPGTPAFIDNQIYLRSGSELWRLDAP